MSTPQIATSRKRGIRSIAIGTGVALLASIGVGATSVAPVAAASFTVGSGVEALGVIATGANGGSSLLDDETTNNPGGTGAVVTAVISSDFDPGDSIEATAGTGGGAQAAWVRGGGGGGRTVVTNTTSATDLVIAGGGGGAATGGSGGNAGVLASGDGSPGGSGIARNGRGGAGGVGGAAGTGNGGTGVSGGTVDGGDGMAELYFEPNTHGGYGAVGNSGGAFGFGPSGGGGGAGYGGGGGGGHSTTGEGGGGGGGGAGGSFSVSSDRAFEQADPNPGSGQSGTGGSAVVTWIEQSTVNAALGSAPGEIDLSWDEPGFSTDSSQLGDIAYEIYRDGTLIGTTSGTSFTDSPGAGTHNYQVISVAPLNSKVGDEVGELRTASDAVTAPAIISSPTVTSVSPNTGSTSGGTDVTITGTGFLPGATVTIGATTCAPVVVVSSTTITCQTGAHAAGAVAVAITNTDTGSTSMANAFTYTGGGSTVKKPLKPTKVVVSGGPRSATRVLRWQAPVNRQGIRPVTYYRLKLNRLRCRTLIVNKKLSRQATRYSFKRSLLLKNMTCRTVRGDARPQRAVFQARIEAFNSAGGGPVSTARFLVRR